MNARLDTGLYHLPAAANVGLPTAYMRVLLDITVSRVQAWAVGGLYDARYLAKETLASAYLRSVANLPAPLTNADRQALTREWLACGMGIGDVRRQLAQHPVRIEIGA